LIQSNQKSSQQKGFFAAQGLYPANHSKPRAANYCPKAAHAQCCGKICYALPTHKATIVLPDFIRSCSAVGKKKKR